MQSERIEDFLGLKGNEFIRQSLNCYLLKLKKGIHCWIRFLIFCNWVAISVARADCNVERYQDLAGVNAKAAKEYISLNKCPPGFPSSNAMAPAVVKAEGTKPPTDQNGSLIQAKSNVLDGAKKTNVQLNETIDLKNHGIELADNHSLDAQKIIKDKVEAQNPTPESNKVLALEALQVAKARSAYLHNTQFPIEEVAPIKDPRLREDLAMVSVAQEGRKNLEQEENRLTDQLSQLLQLASAAMERGENLNSAGSETSAAGEKAGVASKQISSRKIASGAYVADIPASKEGGKKLDADTETQRAVAEKIGKLAQMVGMERKDSNLAKRLREKLANLEALSDVERFKGKLTEEGSSGISIDKAKGNQAGVANKDEVVRSALDAMQSAPFTLAGSQTDSEVQRIKTEAEKELGLTGSMDKIPGIDSLSLFLRVKAVHDNCVRRSCVASVQH